MRIAYVTLHLGSSILNGGVGKKIQSQVSHWKSAGHQVHLFLHSPEKIDVPGSSSYLFLKKISLPIIGSVSKEMSRIRALAELIRAVQEYMPDLIYLRFGLFCFPLKRLFSIAPVVVELNSLDQQEYRYRGEFYYWINRLGRQIILSHAAGFIAVSNEIAQDISFTIYQKPTYVIPNGIDLKKYDVLPASGNAVPRLVFIGTPGYPWHGVDKLVYLADNLPDVHLDIIGYSKQDIKTTYIPENLTLYNFLQQDAFREVFSHCDLAIGSMALHRNRMEEGCPLKVREYLAHGLPVILGFHDTDLSVNDHDFILQIPNSEDNIKTHLHEIHDFAYRMIGNRVKHELVEPLIDQFFKEKRRLEFFEKIIGKHVV